MEIFRTANVVITPEGSADVRILGLLLLARTLSNLKAALLLGSNGLVVEANTMARCCYENQFWVGALVRDREKFRSSMLHHEMKHKRMRAQTLFSTARGLRDEVSEKLRVWMREHKEYEDSPTLDPKKVAMRAKNAAAYVFYQQLSWDAHPSVETLNRYFVQPDEQGIPSINVQPDTKPEELTEMLNLLSLAVVGVFVGVGELLGRDNNDLGKMTAEYQELTKATASMAV
jgi:hypothetical protein